MPRNIGPAAGFVMKGFLVAAGARPTRAAAGPSPTGRLSLLTPGPGPRLHLRDPAGCRLERFALTVTGPDRAANGDPLAMVDAAHERVQIPLREGAPFGYDPRPVQEAGLAEAPRRPRREAPETAEARRGARPLLNRRGVKYEIHC